MSSAGVRSAPTGLTVLALASKVGVGRDTVRYYERVGLLPEPPRSPAGYRLYDGQAVCRLGFIRSCRRLGLRLREIADLLRVRDSGVCPCEPAEGLLRHRISEIDAELSRLEGLRDELTEMVRRLPTQECPDSIPGQWCPVEKEASR